MSGGGKKRRALEKGREESRNFTRQATDTLDPFVQTGRGAQDIIASSLGIGDPNLAAMRFEASPFYQMGNTAFVQDRDAINAGLASQGLAFSGARTQAVEDARERNRAQAFNNFLNTAGGLGNQGFSAAGQQSNALQRQAGNEIGISQSIANTHRGFLGGLQDVAGIATAFRGGR